MKKIFNEDDTWSPEAIEFCSELASRIEELMRLYVSKGYSVRELSAIAHGTITETECKLMIERKFKDRSLINE